MAEDSCVFCNEPLVIELEPDSEDDQNTSKSKATDSTDRVLDDVELSCGCHYHWECFLEAYTVTECPTCAKDIASISPNGKTPQVLCTVRNEGGVQPNFDILPIALEETYLRAFPEDRRGHAFLQFCQEGDLDAIFHIIKDEEEQETESGEREDILRFQKKSGGESGLHVAVQAGQEEVAWLLLALGTELPWSQFPENVLQAMQEMSIQQTERRGSPDLRSLSDSQQRTPLAVAKEVGGVWTSWIGKGLLSM